MRRLALRWGLAGVLLAGLALRIYWALTVLDGVHPDEHYQTLEPAGRLVYGYGWLSWEWQADQALRSWLGPLFFVPGLWLLKLAGFNGGAPAIMVSQLQVALLCAAALAGFAWWLGRIGVAGPARLLAVAWLALSPTMIAWSTATTTDVLAMGLFWALLPAAWSRPGTALSAFLLGLSIVMRIQMAALVLPVLAWRAWETRDRRAWLRTGAGLGLAALPLAVTDWVSWGWPFASAYNNIRRNWVDSVASFYGVSPWYDYLPRLLENFGDRESILLFGLALLALAGFLSRPLGRETRALWLGGALYLLAHSLIPHKETRFLVPAYPLAFLAAAAVAQAVWDRWPQRAELWLALALPLALWLGPWRESAIVNAAHFSHSSISRLMLEIRKKGGVEPSGCVLFVDHYWVWAQGELLQGKPTPYVEEASGKLTAASLARCRFAVLWGGARERFEKAAPQWRLAGLDRWGHLLYELP